MNVKEHIHVRIALNICRFSYQNDLSNLILLDIVIHTHETLYVFAFYILFNTFFFSTIFQFVFIFIKPSKNLFSSLFAGEYSASAIMSAARTYTLNDYYLLLLLFLLMLLHKT